MATKKTKASKGKTTGSGRAKLSDMAPAVSSTPMEVFSRLIMGSDESVSLDFILTSNEASLRDIISQLQSYVDERQEAVAEFERWYEETQGNLNRARRLLGVYQQTLSSLTQVDPGVAVLVSPTKKVTLGYQKYYTVKVHNTLCKVWSSNLGEHNIKALTVLVLQELERQGETWDRDDVYARVSQSLTKLKVHGHIVHVGRGLYRLDSVLKAEAIHVNGAGRPVRPGDVGYVDPTGKAQRQERSKLATAVWTKWDGEVAEGLQTAVFALAWDHGPVQVRDVEWCLGRGKRADKRPTYKQVQNVCQRMCAKGVLVRWSRGLYGVKVPASIRRPDGGVDFEALGGTAYPTLAEVREGAPVPSGCTASGVQRDRDASASSGVRPASGKGESSAPPAERALLKRALSLLAKKGVGRKKGAPPPLVGLRAVYKSFDGKYAMDYIRKALDRCVDRGELVGANGMYAAPVKKGSSAARDQPVAESKGSLVLQRVKRVLEDSDRGAVTVEAVHKGFDGEFTQTETRKTLNALVELGALTLAKAGAYKLASEPAWDKTKQKKLRGLLSLAMNSSPGTGWTAEMIYKEVNRGRRKDTFPFPRIQQQMGYLATQGILVRAHRGVFVWAQGHEEAVVNKYVQIAKKHWAKDPSANWEKVSAALMARDATYSWGPASLKEELRIRGIDRGKSSLSTFFSEHLKSGNIVRDPKGGYYWAKDMDKHAPFPVPEEVKKRKEGVLRPVRRTQTEVPGTSAKEGESSAPGDNGEKKYHKPGVHVPEHMREG